MQITEDTLMRYADGELEPADRAEVEAAIRADAALGRRVEAFRAQRARLAKAFAPVLNEPVPDRLRQILEPPSAQVTDLAVRRESKRLAERVRAWSWPEVGAIAAALVLGVVIAQQVGREDGEAFHTGPNGVVASRAVSRALSEQLASTQPADAAVRVGLTFENQAGDFCRTFVQRAGDLNGIACRRDDEWRVNLAVVSPAHGDPTGSGVRTAGSDVPAEVLKMVEAQIRGEVLDAAAEARAKQDGWRTAKP